MATKLCLLASLGTLIVLAAAQDSDYCDIPSCKGNPHTLCIYSSGEVSDNCGNVTSSQLSDDDIQQLVDLHNSLRYRVASGQEDRGNPGPQPASTNLGDMQWDDELSNIAQTWADQCIDDHDSCRDVPEYSVGQNIAWAATSGDDTFTLEDMFNQWYNEVDTFDGRTVGSFIPKKSYLHYTQLVWAESTQVGCGLVRYNNDGQWNSVLLVCNYGPTGNVVGRPVYETA